MFNLNNLCFLCLTYNKYDSNQNSDYLKVQEELEYIIPIDILQKSKVPKYICVSCFDNLNNITKFRKMCLQNIVIFNEHVQKWTQQSDSFNESTNISQHEKYQIFYGVDNNTNDFGEKVEKPNFTEIIKKEVTETNNIELEESREDKLSKEIEINELFVNNEKDEKPNFTGIIKNEIPETNNMELKESRNDKLSKEIEIDKLFVNYENKIEDICVTSDINEEFIIKEENMQDNFNEKEYINQQQHWNIKNFQVENYEHDSGPSSQNVDYPIEPKMFSPPKPKHHQCPECEKAFQRLQDLKQHIRVHTKERPYECDTCFRRFSTSKTLTIHKRIHTGEKPYACETCGKTFTDTSNLARHKKSHNNLYKPFQCSFCEKTFMSNQYLRSHMLIHTGEKPFKCTICEKMFRQAGSLHIHMRVHTGDKPFKCTFCAYKTAQSNTLKSHIRTHTGEKPCVCEVCSKAFTKSSSLRAHMKIHNKTVNMS